MLAIEASTAKLYVQVQLHFHNSLCINSLIKTNTLMVYGFGKRSLYNVLQKNTSIKTKKKTISGVKMK